jgi:hypothetical protein
MNGHIEAITYAQHQVHQQIQLHNERLFVVEEEQSTYHGMHVVQYATIVENQEEHAIHTK